MELMPCLRTNLLLSNIIKKDALEFKNYTGEWKGLALISIL